MNDESKKRRKELTLEIADRLVAEYGMSSEAVFGGGGILKDLAQAVLERALAGELTHHLGYKKGERSKVGEAGSEEEGAGEPQGRGNCRNGSSRKVVLCQDGKMEIAVPRDREGSFEPLMLPKHEKRFDGFDERIVGMYARGMSVREIQEFLREQYQVTVSPALISSVTEEVMSEVREWQGRPLEKLYCTVFFDAMRVKIRDEGTVKNKAVYFALGVDAEGKRDVLGFWIEQNEGAKFWLKVMNELRSRGVEDILVAVVDGLKGFPEAITTAFPQTTVQTCIVHLLRHSLAYCNWKDRQAVATELKGIYKAATADLALERLEEFEKGKWGAKYPMIAASWKRAWEEVIPFFSYPPEIRKLLYTTNAIESFHMQLRKVLKNRGHFPSDEAASKLIYLALRNIVARWKGRPSNWQEAANHFAILYPERFRREE